MKKYVLHLLTCSILILVSCSKTNNTQNTLPNYTNFSELTANYTLEDAKTDGCVVFEDLSLTSGEAEWNKFLKVTKSSQTATIRIANYYSKEDSNLYFIDLSYDGSTYSVTEKDGVSKQYKYLNHYIKEAETGADYPTIDCYILVNEKDVSYNELDRSLISSNSNDYIDQYRIYVNQLK